MPSQLDHATDVRTDPWSHLDGLPDHPPVAHDWHAPPPPPAGPPPGGSAWPPPLPGTPASPPRRSSGRLGVVLFAALLLVCGLVGLTGGMAVREAFAPARPSAAGAPSARVPSRSPSGAAPSTTLPSPSNQPSTGQSQGTANWDQIEQSVDDGIVDIVSRMPGGVGAGTGMVLSDSGQILTNNHVVDGASDIVVTLVTTGERYDASVVGTNPEEDVAVLQLADASGLATIPLGDSDSVQVGDEVAAMGNAGGQGGEPDVATGRVVALHQSITAANQDGSNQQTLTDTIQVNANVQEGDSGGPLVNADGKVVGMDAAASVSNGRRQRTAAHQGFAIPINKAVAIAHELTSGGSSASNGSNGSRRSNGSNGSNRSNGSGSQATGRPLLGVQTRDGSGRGAVVVAVQGGSPAASVGLTAGDTILAVDGTTVGSADDLVTALGEHRAGDQVSISWITADGEQQRTTVTLAER